MTDALADVARNPPIYAVARPLLIAHLERQRVFSRRIFVRRIRADGILAHIRKEMAAIADTPDNVVEYADVVILTFAGALWAGIAPDELADRFLEQLGWLNIAPTHSMLHYAVDKIASDPRKCGAWAGLAVTACDAAANRPCLSHMDVIAAVIVKQAINEGRRWPDWRDMPTDAPIEHVKTSVAAPAHPVPTWFVAFFMERLEVRPLYQESASTDAILGPLRGWLADHGGVMALLDPESGELFSGCDVARWVGILTFARGGRLLPDTATPDPVTAADERAHLLNAAAALGAA